MQKARQECDQLKTELSLRSKPEADAINELQTQLKAAQATTEVQRQDFIHQVNTLSHQVQVLSQKQVPELVPLQDFIKVTQAQLSILQSSQQALDQRIEAVKVDLAHHKTWDSH